MKMRMLYGARAPDSELRHTGRPARPRCTRPGKNQELPWFPHLFFHDKISNAMVKQKHQNTIGPDTRQNVRKRLLQISASLIFIAIVLFVSAGSFRWLYGWLYIAASVLILSVNAFVFPVELISERGRKKENIEQWDKVMSGLITIPWLALFFVSGLDIRFGWTSEWAVWIHLAGLVVFFLGNALVSWSMISNLYFSTAVRIQYDRGHTVASGGPYRFVRHPGYVGMIIFNLATPFLLGSAWALIPAGLTAVLFMARTHLEDNTLKEKLEGYREYADKVKYRLMPGVW